MSPRLKSIVLLVITLVIGGVVGALLNARLAEQRIERLASFRSERGFMRYIERVVEPEDEEQREQVREVLRVSAERMARHREESWREARALLDSTRAELRSILTDDQARRLEEHLEAMRPGRGRAPHRGGGPSGRRGERPRRDSPPAGP